MSVTRQIDPLDRLDAIPGVADYGYRGPDLVAERSLGALSATRSFDGARRPVRDRVTDSSGWSVFDEQLAWSPRSLKVGLARGDTGEGLQLAHDGAGRLVQAERTVSLPANNSAPTAGSLTTGDGYTYDAAQNLLAHREARAGVETTTNLPLDGSGRNRPGALTTTGDGVNLAWDAQGNLAEKGNLRFHWDYRNRLTRVTDSVGTEVASYTYDAFNRRIAKTAGGVCQGTRKRPPGPAGSRSSATRPASVAERRTYGAGLDEVVRIESDLDGDGTLEQSYTPVYDHTGNLALVTDSVTGQVIERYRLSPYGERTILLDSTPPAVEQLRVQADELWLEISEGVHAEALQAALAAGAVTLTETTTSTDVALTATQPVQEGGQAFRRIVLTPDTAPAGGTTVELRIEPAALIDAFGNQPGAAYVQSFAWPPGDLVLDDTAAPEVEVVRLVDRFVEIELTEEPDLATVATAVTVDGAQLTWTLGADRYTVRSSDALAAGAATLTVATTLADLAGTTLAESLTEPVPATVPDVELFEAPDPRESFSSTIANRAGFHGLDHDPDTGLVYVRNRWLDPALGRFVSTDPMGYLDSPSLYSFVGNNPANVRDPLGLYIVGGQRELALLRSALRKAGASDKAAMLRLEKQPVPGRHRVGDLADAQEEWHITNGGASWTSSLQGPLLDPLAWLVDTAIDTDWRVIIEIHDSGLRDLGGARTDPESGLPWRYEEVTVQVNPHEVVGQVVPGRTRFHELTEITILDAEMALVHELGHAMGYYHGGAPTYGGDTSYWSLHFENVYRKLIIPENFWPLMRTRELVRWGPFNVHERAVRERLEDFFLDEPNASP